MSQTDDLLSTVERAAEPSNDQQAEIQLLKHQLHAAEAEARRARQLFTHSPQAAFTLSPEGRVLEANVQASVILGRSAASLTGHRLGNVLAPSSQATFTALLSRAFSSGARAEAELTLLDADGAAHAVFAAVQRAGTQDEPPVCQMTVTAVTNLKQAHLHLLDQVESLQRTVQEHDVRNRRQAQEMQDVIQATQVHLNRQLTQLRNALSLHQTEVEAAGVTFAHLENSQAVLRAAFGLMESLEQYLEARQLRLRTGPVDLNRTVLDVRKDLEVVLEDRNVDWSPTSLPTILGDSRALRIILREYVSNALKFTRTRDVTRLQWHVEDTEGHYLIGLQDNGVGFNQRQKDRAFELFGRLHPTGAYEGTGIGLAVVRWLAERGGGRAWGEGKVDQGATFWVACPKVPSRD